MKEKALAVVGMTTIASGIPAWYVAGPVAGDIVMMVGLAMVFTAAWMLAYKDHKAKQDEINKLKK